MKIQALKYLTASALCLMFTSHSYAKGTTDKTITKIEIYDGTSVFADQSQDSEPLKTQCLMAISKNSSGEVLAFGLYAPSKVTKLVPTPKFEFEQIHPAEYDLDLLNPARFAELDLSQERTKFDQLTYLAGGSNTDLTYRILLTTGQDMGYSEAYEYTRESTLLYNHFIRKKRCTDLKLRK